MSATVAVVGAAVLVKVALVGALIVQRRRNHHDDKVVEEQQRLAHLARVAIVGELSGGLAHELNQPLTSILCNAQAAQRALACKDVDIAELREIMDDIVAEDRRAGALIARLRQLLKREEPTLAPICLNHVLNEVQVLVRRSLSEQGVKLTTRVDAALPAVRGDGVQIQQVLLNLLLNACDALSDVEPADRRIEVEASLERGGDFVLVRVCDHGPGIEKDGLERVFDAFFTTKPNGLGLGLAICRQIATAHGGRLWATRNGGRGAAFHLTLPVANRCAE